MDLYRSALNIYDVISNESVSLFGFTAPLPVVIIGAVGVILFFFTSRPGKRKPWRLAASKKWLKEFRESRSKYSPQQRFSFIRKVDHFLWEEILMSCFEERGYSIIRTKMTRDGGSDGFVTIGGNLIIIQAKRYKGNISKAHVMDLLGLVESNKRFDKGLFIHTGKTSGPIISLFKSNGDLELLSGVDSILNFLDGEPLHLFGYTLARANK